jgi:hypothetical protein
MGIGMLVASWSWCSDGVVDFGAGGVAGGLACPPANAGAKATSAAISALRFA